MTLFEPKKSQEDLKLWFTYKYRKFTHHIYEGEKFKSYILFTRFQENLEVFVKLKEKNSWFMYIWGGKSCLILVNKFENHSHLFVKLHALRINFGLNYASHVKPLPPSVKYVYEI